MNHTKRNRSFGDLTLGPSQRSELSEPSTSSSSSSSASSAGGSTPGHGGGTHRPRSTAGGPSFWWVYAFAAFAVGVAGLYAVDRDRFDALAALAGDCVALRRLPATAQDNSAAMVWILLSLPVIMVLDFCVCYPLSRSHVARWYFVHAATNAIITVLAAPDLYYTLVAPQRGMSVAYCELLPFPACTDLPTCFIVGLHLYHVLFFVLTKDDVFHHLLFVPIVCFAHFAWPCGSAGNILCFFISGFPGGMDYFLLGLVKNGAMHPLKEKRLNCSINTWIRAPGITLSCAFFWAGFVALEEGEQDIIPGVVLWEVAMGRMVAASGIVPVSICAGLTPPTHNLGADLLSARTLTQIIMGLIFYNGNFYAQRVVGNYYIWKAEGAAKAGKRAALHGS